MSDPKKLDLSAFLSDPKHQADKDFLFGVINHAIDERVKKEKETASKDEPHFLDRLFGGMKSE